MRILTTTRRIEVDSLCNEQLPAQWRPLVLRRAWEVRMCFHTPTLMLMDVEKASPETVLQVCSRRLSPIQSESVT